MGSVLLCVPFFLLPLLLSRALRGDRMGNTRIQTNLLCWTTKTTTANSLSTCGAMENALPSEKWLPPFFRVSHTQAAHTGNTIGFLFRCASVWWKTSPFYGSTNRSLLRLLCCGTPSWTLKTFIALAPGTVCVCFWTKVVKQMFPSRDIDYRLISDALQISESEGEKCHVFGGLYLELIGNWHLSGDVRGGFVALGKG